MSADGTRSWPGPATPGAAGGWLRRRTSALSLLALTVASFGPAALAAALEPAAPSAAPVPWATPGIGMDPTFAPTVGHWPPSTVLQRTLAPDPDAIRRARLPSIARTARLDPATRLVVLDRFGRRVETELAAALGPVDELILDLRHNHGGNVRFMLRAAARFTGPVPDALRLVADDGVITVLAIPDPSGPVWAGRLTVLVGDDTISSGEVLAALLRHYARAAVLGERTWGKDFAMRVVQIDDDWRALVPAGRLEVPGEVLHGGLLPDGPIPPALLTRVADRHSGARAGGAD